MADFPDSIKSYLPAGWDRADGLEPQGPNGGATAVGTATKDGQIEAVSALGEGVSNIPIEEFPDSPTLERAEQATLTHRFRMPWNTAHDLALIFSRGGIREDSYGDVYKLLSATWQREKGGTAIMTTVEEAISYDNPPDEFELTPVELGVHIIKHPRYYHAFLGETGADEQKNQMVIRLLQDYFENTTAAHRDAIIWMLQQSLTVSNGVGAQQPPHYTPATTYAGSWPTGARVKGTEMAKRAALEIVIKYWRGEECPSLVGWKISWSSYVFRPPYINPGGYIECPYGDYASPQLPEYFWSPVAFDDPLYGDPAYTIFDLMGETNPQAYGAPDSSETPGATEISWRREADQISYQRTWWRIVRSWVGSPIGYWDPDLYTQEPRPANPDDYLPLAP